jgi:hypothetical protein
MSGRGRLFVALWLHAISFRRTGDIASLEVESAGITDHRSCRRATPKWGTFRTAIAERLKSVTNLNTDEINHNSPARMSNENNAFLPAR